MATGTANLSISAAMPPDGTTGNAAPRLLFAKGSNATPNRFLFYAAFAPSVQQNLWWAFYVPTNYASGGTVRLMWEVNTTGATAVVWGASVGVQASAASESFLVHAQAAVTTTTTTILGTTAQRPLETLIALGNLDGMAADALATLCVFRQGTNGADTCTTDAGLLVAAFDYTAV